MDNDEQRQAATSRDVSRQAATRGDSDYSLSIEEALARYDAAGVPRTPRSIQRYCAKGDLDCHRVETPFGIKFLITPASVDRHIAYIQEVRQVATGRGMSRLVATESVPEIGIDEPRHEAATTSDERRQPATDPQLSQPVAAQSEPVSQPVAADARIVQMLERENEFLREQIDVKDGQIKEMTERAKETNLLINGLQRMLSPLLSAPRDINERRQFDGVHVDEGRRPE